MRQRPPHAHILEKRAAQIPTDVGIRGTRRGENRETFVVEERAHRPGVHSPEIHLPCFESEAQGEGVGQDAEDDGVEPWSRRTPVIFAADQPQIFIRAPLTKAERTGSHRPAVEVFRPPLRGFSPQDMRGDNGHPPTVERGRVGFAVAHAHFVRSGRFDFPDESKIGFARGGDRVVHDRLIRETDIIRSEWRAVLPEHSFSQLKNNPGFGEKTRFRRIPVRSGFGFGKIAGFQPLPEAVPGRVNIPGDGHFKSASALRKPAHRIRKNSGRPRGIHRLAGFSRQRDLQSGQRQGVFNLL